MPSDAISLQTHPQWLPGPQLFLRRYGILNAHLQCPLSVQRLQGSPSKQAEVASPRSYRQDPTNRQRMRTAWPRKRWVGCNPDAYPLQTDPVSGTSVSKTVNWGMHRARADWQPAASHDIHIRMAWHNLRGGKPHRYVYSFPQRYGSILCAPVQCSLGWAEQRESSIIHSDYCGNGI